VVIVAHPNDEVIGAGGLISRLRDVTVLHVTDGVSDNNHPAGPNFQREETARQLRKECGTALALANVNDERIVGFGVPWRQAPLHLTELTRRIAAFLKQTEPDIVLTHPYEGGHPDHDATAFATHAALHLLRRNGFTPPSVFEIALHPARDGKSRVLDFLPNDAAEITTLLLDKKTRELKRQMFECLADQPALQRENSFARERFRRPPRYNFEAPPNGGNVIYQELTRGLDSSKWSTLVSDAWSNLFPDESVSH
jgi:LmbE family N-acetylglucosaminyl deacetylase